MNADLDISFFPCPASVSKRLQSCKESLVHRGPLEADINMHHSEISPQTDWNVRKIF